MTDDVFLYKNFSIAEDHTTVSFDYEIKKNGITHTLQEILKFPVELSNSDAQQHSLRALHLALGISYYKTFLPSTIQHPYTMGSTEVQFWNNIWANGLGEFLYVNKLSRDMLAEFSVQEGVSFESAHDEAPARNGAILGIGGGKDSIVAGELLKEIGVEVTGFVMATGEQLGQTKSVAKTMGVELLVVERFLDKQLLELQEKPGAYKGHIPISLIFGLVGAALAIATHNKYTVVANEASASIPRIEWLGNAVNHQWSKSYEFEKELQKFIITEITPSVTYFSAVRSLTSVAIAKLFSSYEQYFEVFTSDNYVFRIDPSSRPNGRWSLESPKSLSSFILLAPWLSEGSMWRIFGDDFLDQRSLEQLFLELLGKIGHPPLDCIGTVEELTLSINLTSQQDKFTKSYLMDVAREKDIIKYTDYTPELDRMLRIQTERAVPRIVDTVLVNILKEKLTI